MKNLKLKSGFSLIEVIIYISLLSIVSSSLIVSTYSISQSLNKNKVVSVIDDEGLFLVNKIKWILYDSEKVGMPVLNESGQKLIVEKTINSIQTEIKLKMNKGDIEIQFGQNQATALNSSVVNISDLKFSHKSVGEYNNELVLFSFNLTSTTTNGFPVKKNFKEVVYLKNI